jgi:hypothetical protein
MIISQIFYNPSYFFYSFRSLFIKYSVSYAPLRHCISCRHCILVCFLFSVQFSLTRNNVGIHPYVGPYTAIMFSITSRILSELAVVTIWIRIW